ncbi:MAG: 1-acyl-sn-glycerol-3-phosphate acyltransferase [Lachnospiraceae bacterium]|nr:1-acyl-sn-glycerol-3-phosphate acyltransferase [Lachnospiraceae bacterium]
MIRLIVVLIFVLIFLLLSFIIQPIMLLAGLFSKRARDIASQGIVNWAFRVVLFLCGVKAEVKGEENVPKDEAVLYILNHNSFFDIIFTYPRVPRPTGYIAKKEMLRFLTLTWWMKLLHCEFLDRKDLRAGMKTINSAAESIKNGYSMAIFPEGTRNKSDEAMLPFHAGSFKIAEKSDCKIVPVVLYNTAAIFEDHLPFIKKANIKVEYLPPIDVAPLSRDERKELPDKIRDMMLTTYLQMK